MLTPGSPLSAWLSWLESLSPREIDLGLDRVHDVLGRLDIEYPEHASKATVIRDGVIVYETDSPLANRFRTGLTMGMFAVVVFSVIFMATAFKVNEAFFDRP